jgi:hypothetical protein
MIILQKDDRKTVLMFPVNYDGLSINALAVEMTQFHVEVSRVTNQGEGQKFVMSREEALAFAHALIDNEQERTHHALTEAARIADEIGEAEKLLDKFYHGEAELKHEGATYQSTDWYSIWHDGKLLKCCISPVNVLVEVKQLLHHDGHYEPTEEEVQEWYG